MNRRHLLKTLTLSALGAGAFPISANSAAAGPLTEKPKSLSVGDTLQYDSELEVTFLAVRKDHRCPINAQCLTAGDAVVVLRIKAGNQKAKTVSLHTKNQPRRLVIPANRYPEGFAGIPKSYVIGIRSLNPLPYSGKKTPRSAYRLKLHISVAV